MTPTRYSYLFLALAAFIACSLLSASYFPYLGITLSIILLALTIYYFTVKKSRWFLVACIFTLLFAFFVMYRANELLTFLNIVAAIYFGSLMLTSSETSSFIDVLAAPLNAFFSAIKRKFSYQLRESTSKRSIKQLSRWKNATIGIGISVLLLLIIVPLLSAANPIFKQWVDASTDFLFGPTVFKWISDNVVVIVRVAVGFIALVFILPRFIIFSNEKKQPFLLNLIPSLPLLIPKVVVASVVVIFFISQLQLYLAGPEMLRQLGYTNSQLTREVFAQLSLVGAILLFLMYNDLQRETSAKITTYILLIETVFLTLIAFKSVFDYSSMWGFTYARLWGFAGVMWMVGALASFLYYFHRELKTTFFVRSIVILSGAVLLMVNVANFDRLIATYRPSTSPGIIDYIYLRRLSPDSKYYRELYDRAVEVSQITNDSDPVDKDDFSFRLMTVEKIRYLKDRYQHIDWRSFNYSEYREYWDVKDLDIANIRTT